jgi:hypothetical protein
MSDPNPNLGLGGPSLDDEKALKKGNTGVLVAGILAALVVLAGVVYLLAQEQPDQYGAVGRQVNRMKSEHFDGFWACALPGLELDRLGNDQDLRYEINKRARPQPRVYARHIREQCLPKLAQHDAPLQVVISPPQDLREPLGQIGTALETLRDGWGEYLHHLERVETYDEEEAQRQLTGVARGWFDYKRAHRAVNQSIQQHANE